MSTRTLTSAITAVMLTLGALGAGTNGAAAGQQAATNVQYQPFHRYEQDWRHDRNWRHDRGFRRNICEPGEAVYKARRMGLRHAGIVRIDHHAIVVAGRNWGHRASVVFARRSPHCAVIDRRGI